MQCRTALRAESNGVSMSEGKAVSIFHMGHIPAIIICEAYEFSQILFKCHSIRPNMVFYFNTCPALYDVLLRFFPLLLLAFKSH